MEVFNAERIGQTIAAARKQKNMTQSALADELGVSYQAVSNWERSQSLPDIDKYETLAKVLDLPLAQLLGSQAARTVIQVASAAPLDATTLQDAAPVMTPKQVEARADAKQLTLAELVPLAPFLSSTTLVEGIKANSATPTFLDDLQKLAPFLQSSDLEHLIAQYVTPKLPDTVTTVIALAPFRSSAANNATLASLHDQNIPLNLLQKLFPFVANQTLAAFVQEAGTDAQVIKAAAPFLTKEQNNAVFAQTAKRDPQNKLLQALAPFVSEAQLTAHIHRLAENGAEEQISSFMPFLSEAAIIQLVKQS
ncbi:helix-turn-helix domain-containing protein [Lacticaseibacillus mingshuiensis]|uniref:Helix-turn-helix domain-containing protein n=1 Tax=Lacticaseibacillus mingshuiensis TaxID=2799574 RepID=A0ABW4CHF8_9LACO|nr:helix-turn-helix transcriptional regulator [Lacticaseibacillus mingshuiensis]